MQHPATIFVTGATGNQGGAAVRHLLDKGFRVKALVRNPDSLAAQELKKTGAELTKGDLDAPATYGDALKGVEGVFSVQALGKVEKEKKQGIGLVNKSNEAGVWHFVYCSVIGADANTGIPHWESKNEIEKQLKRSGLSYTILRPSSFFENFLLPPVKSRILKGKLVTPTEKKKVQQFISTTDVGRIGSIIFMDPGKYRGRTIELASEQMDMEEVAAVFSRILGKKIKYQKMPKLITRLVLGSDLYKMFNWVNHNDVLFVKDLPGHKKEFPGMQGLEEWILQHFGM